MPKIKVELTDLQKAQAYLEELKIEARALENLDRLNEDKLRRMERHERMEDVES